MSHSPEAAAIRMHINKNNQQHGSYKDTLEPTAKFTRLSFINSIISFQFPEEAASRTIEELNVLLESGCDFFTR